jgi:hypothetical protein
MIIDIDGYNTQVEFPDDTPQETIQKVLAESFPPIKEPERPAEPIPFDLDGTLAMADPENTAHKGDVTAVLYPFARSFMATGYTTAAALNRGLGMFAAHLDTISDYVSAKTGAQKGGIFEKAAKQYQENTAYWQDRANKVGVSFLEELFGEAIGGAVPGIAEFALDIPYAGALGAAEASKDGKGEIAGALVESAKRGVLGLVFKAMNPLNQYLRAPAMGTVFGLQTAMEGGDVKEVAKGFGTGVLYSLTSPGGQMGLNEIRRNLEKKIVLDEAKKPVVDLTQKKDGETIKVDPFDQIDVDAVKYKGEPVSAMAPEAGFRREPSSVGSEGDPVTRRSDLVRFLTEKLDIPIRTGRFRDKALGIFKPKSEVIRTQNANDIEVISHEIGHALQKFLFPESLKATGLSSQPFAAFQGELTPLATKPKAGQDIVPEGFAEFVRLYVTNPAQAQAKAPSFYQHFEHLLDSKSPESREILLAARGHYQKYLEQPALQRVLGQISVGETGDRKNTLHDLYTATIDDLHPLKQIVDEMAQGRKLTATENPYKLARLMRGWSGKVDAFLRNKPFKFKTYEDVGKSFQEIIKPVEGKLEEFRAYIVSKRTIELGKRTENVETGVLLADAKEIIKKYDGEFSQAFNDLKEYQDHTLNYLRDSGVIGKDTYAKIKALNDDYVPLYRVMEQTEGKGAGAGLEARNPIKKIKGSWRDIQDPLESIIKNTYLYINMAEKNAIGEALVKMAEKNDGMGKFVEKIPTPMQETKITPEELAKFGLDNVPEDAVSIFRPSAFMPKENVITVYRNGEKELYQVHPDVARTFQALDKESVGLLEKALSYPASWLRAGATLTPEFIARNPVRDQFSSFLYSKYGFIPGVDLVRGIFNLAGKTDLYWNWKKGGGDHSMLVSMDRSYMQDQLSDVLQKYPVKNLIRNPIEGLRVLSELGEAGTRIGEFRKGLIVEGATKEGIQQAGFAAREVTLDFARKGAAGKAMNMITAFWNAGLQGQDKMIREFHENPLGMAWKTAAAITLPSVLLAIANHDDPRYKDVPQWQRDLFWIIPTDSAIYRIPKPFEIGILFGSVPERIVNHILDDDSHAFDGMLDSILRAGTPSVVPTAAVPIMENWANRSAFFDRPIVPQNRTDLLNEYQYGPYTTETAKAIGRVLGRLPWMDELPISSPAKVENLIYGWTGGLGRYALSIADMSLEAAGVVKPEYEDPAKTLADMPLIKAFVVRYPSASTENITRFYDDYEKVTKRLNSFKAMQKEGRFDEAMRIMEGGSLENLNGTYQALRNVHSTIDAVTANPLMKPDEKREFTDILYMQMTDIAKTGNQYIDQIREMEKQMKKDRETELKAAPESRVIPMSSRKGPDFRNVEPKKQATGAAPVF